MCPESESFEGWVMIWLKCSEYEMIKHFRVFLSFFNYIRICLAFPFKFSEMSKFLFSRRSDPDVLSGSQQQAKRPVYKISLLLVSALIRLIAWIHLTVLQQNGTISAV